MRGRPAPYCHSGINGYFSPLFKVVKTSDDLPPRCDVLFFTTLSIWRDLYQHRPFANLSRVLVLALQLLLGKQRRRLHFKGVGRRTDWSANIAMIVDRKDDRVCPIFLPPLRRDVQGTFHADGLGRLAPQIPGRAHTEVPDSIMTAEAGHVTFSRMADKRVERSRMACYLHCAPHPSRLDA